MFRLLNKIIKSHRLKIENIFLGIQQREDIFSKKISSRGGQVAVILILIAAIALIFYAVALNLGRISQTKTLVTIASNTATAQLASSMAGYGENLFQVTLGGKRKVCGLTGILAAIISIIIAIIALVLAIFTAGQTIWPALTVILAIIGAVLATAALILQIAVVQPGLTALWNKIIDQNLAITDQFVERGIQGALQGAVTDNNQVPDKRDLDLDRMFDNSPGGPSNSQDKINRFAYYYTKRLLSIETADLTAINDFQNALRSLIYAQPLNDPYFFGLYDPLCRAVTGSPFIPLASPWDLCCQNPVPANAPAECNPCCVPEFIEIPDSLDPTQVVSIRTRPECCDSGGPNQCGTASGCAATSPYGAVNPYVYNPFFENETNNFTIVTGNPATDVFGIISLKEAFGKDDEHRKFKKQPPPAIIPASPPYDPNNPITYPQTYETGVQDFRLEDVSGYYRVDRGYSNLIKDTNEERRVGMFAFMYKMRDWGTDLVNATTSGVSPFPYGPSSTAPLHCQWCDAVTANAPGAFLGALPNCSVANHINLPNISPELTPLSLPQQPLSVTLASAGVVVPPYDGGYCVDGANISVLGFPSGPPQRPDKVPDSWFITAQANECVPGGPNQNACGSNSPYQSLPTSVHRAGASGIWKPGADRFCGDEGPPYPTGAPPYLTTPSYPPLSPPAPTTNPPSHPPTPGISSWPYEIGCAKHGTLCTEPNPDNPSVPFPTDCLCCDGGSGNPGPAASFPEDLIDDFVYGVDEFIGWAEGFLKMDPKDIYNNFEDIYLDIAPWIEPLDGTGIVNDPDAGYLTRWRDEFLAIGEPVFFWARGFTGYEGADCNEVWCIPPTQAITNGYGINECPGVLPVEAGTFQSANALLGSAWQPVRGDVEDVVECLSYNMNNEDRFEQCIQTCTAADCDEPAPFGVGPGLPRSLIPGFVIGGPGSGAPFTFTPPAPGDEVDYARVRDCVTNCSDATCQLLPIYRTSSGGTVQYNAWNDPSAGGANPGGLPPGTGLSPATFNQVVDCAPVGTAPMAPWIAIIEKILVEISPSCDIRGSLEDGIATNDGFMFNVIWSWAFAQNQKVKMEKRRNYLLGRVEEARWIMYVIAQGYSEFNAFLQGPAKDLMDARRNWEGERPGLPNMAIYAWQSDPPPNRFGGYWHIVKVEAKIPRRCGNCGVNGAPDPPWPKVVTYTKNWGTKRCYELKYTTGEVRTQVMRFDEDRGVEPTHRQWIKFPTGQNLWSFRFTRPDRPPLPNMLNNLGYVGGGICGPLMDADAPGAFIMDTRDLYNPSFSMCWNTINEILKSAVSSRTCARYNFRNTSPNKGMDFSFVPCTGTAF